MSDDRYERGAAKVRELYGEAGEQVLGAVQDSAPDLVRYVLEFAFGDVYSRPGLDARSREIATIASLVTQGHAGRELAAHLHGALNAGCSRQEIIEVVIQMAVYAGFPAALGGMAVAREVFAERDRDARESGP